MSRLAADSGNCLQGCAGSSTELDLPEVYFLVLHWLSHGPCKHAAEALLQDVTQQGLLPQQYDVNGGSRPSSYQSLLQEHSKVPADGLLQLLQQCLSRVQAADHAGAQGLQSLLAAGPLAALPSLAAVAAPQVPPWIRHPAKSAAFPQLQLLQQTGLASHSSTSSRRLPLQYVTDSFQHHATFRGHGFPVFSLTYDKEGRRVVTGADDAIVKIWSLETGLLLVTGRGHTGEISDLSLSADGSMVASGSVDGDVRIWSMMDENLGQNIAVLRGHTAPVTLIDFHPTVNSALISASTDGSVRLWDAKDQHFAPLMLLPSDNIGTFGSSIRLAATAAAAAGPVARRSLTGILGAGSAAAPGVAAEDAAEVPRGFLCCSWSPDGCFIVAGCQDCCVYLWHWDLCQQQQRQQQEQHGIRRRSSSGAGVAALGPSADEQQQQQQHRRVTRSRSQSQSGEQQQQAGAPKVVNGDAQQSAVAAAATLLHQQAMVTSADWPVPFELQQLIGHKNEVIQTEFSHEGTRLATGSLDGSVRVWQLVRGSKGKPKLLWQEAIPPLMVVAVEPANTAAAAAARARRREQAQALVVNQVAWAADDSRILAVASDNIIRVWCAHTGALLQLLRGHTQQAHVLDTHPHDARLAMSAGYDGQVILWDVDAGAVLKRFSSSDTIPLSRGSWAPPVIQLCDGHFSPDGNTFCIADVAGQFSLYAVGSPTPLLLSAPYDQFFKKDYDPIMHDEAGFAAFTDPAGVPTYHLKGQQPLCDNQFMPYPDDFQAAYKEGRVYDFVKSGGGGMCMRGSSMTLQTSLQLWPPTVTAAVWKALEDRAGLVERGSSRVASEATTRDTAERHALEEHSKLLAALLRGMTLQEQEQHAQQVTQAAAQRQQQQQRSTAPAAAATAAEEAVNREQRQQQIMDVTEELDNDFDYEDVADLAGSDSDFDADQVQSSDSDWEDHDEPTEELDNDSDVSGQRQGHGQRQSERQRHWRQQRQLEGRGVRARRRGGGQEQVAGPTTRRSAATTPQRQQQAPSTRQQRKRRRNSSSSDAGSSDGDQQDGGDRDRRAQRRSSRRAAAAGVAAAAAAAAAAEDEEEEQYSGSEQDGVLAAAAAGRRSRRQQQSGVELEHQGERQHKRQRQQARDTGAAAAEAAAAAAAAGSSRHGRPLSSYAWMRQSRHSPNTYVPQLGDTVVYLYEGHQKYLDARNDRLTERPWEVLSRPGAGQQQWIWQQQCQWQQQQQEWQQQQQEWQQQQPMQDWQQQWASLHQQAANLSTVVAAVAPAAAAGLTSSPPVTAEAEPTPAAATEGVGTTPAGAPPHGVGPSTAPAEPAAGSTPATAAFGLQEQAAIQAAAAPSSTAAAVGDGDASQVTWLPAPYQMRPAEPCTIVALDYVTQDEQTVAVLTLQLTAAATAANEGAVDAGTQIGNASSASQTADGAASQPDAIAAGPAAAAALAADPAAAAAVALVYPGPGYYFRVVLPHPSSGHADFVILHSRFQEAVSKTWHVGARVQNHLLEDSAEDVVAPVGSWWVGTVAADARIARPHAEVAADPYGCGGLWERYKVVWDKEPADPAAAAAGGEGTPAAAGAANDGDQHEEDGVNGVDADTDESWLSPWELYEAGVSAETVLASEHMTHITTEQVARLLHVLDRMRHSSKYRAFIKAPPPDAVFETDEGDQVYNRVIPLPIGLQNVQERLEAGYYRSLQALLHDAALIASNAATFNGQQNKIALAALDLYHAIQTAAAESELDADQQQQQQQRRNKGGRFAGRYQGAEDGQQQQHQLDPASAAAAVGPDGQQDRRIRRSAASKADVFLAGCAAADVSESGSEDAAAAADSDPEADEALAATGPRSRSSRAKHSRQQRRNRARNRRRGDSSDDYDSEAQASSEDERSHRRPLRRSSRRQQQQQRQQRYKEEYASDFDSEEEEEVEHDMQQQRPRRSSRHHQQQQLGVQQQQQECQLQQYPDSAWQQLDWMQGGSVHPAPPPPPDSAAAAAIGWGHQHGPPDGLAPTAVPGVGGGSAATGQVPPSANGHPAAAAAVAACTVVPAGKGRIRMKLAKSQQQNGVGVHVDTPPVAAGVEGQLHYTAAAAAAAQGAELWNGHPMQDWSAAAAQAAWSQQKTNTGPLESWQQQQWQWQQLGADGMQQFVFDSNGQMHMDNLLQQQHQQQQEGWGQGAQMQEPANGTAAADRDAVELDAGHAAAGHAAVPAGGGRIRLRMRTRSSGS